MLRLTRALAARDRREEPLPRRRRGAQLRRQRQGAARRPLREASGSSRRRAMPAARSARRSAAYHLHAGKPRRAAQRAATACAAPTWARASRRSEIERRLRGCRRALRDRAGGRHDRAHGGRPRRGQGGRLVPGAHGVRAARARRPLDPGRSALAVDAEDAQPASVKYRESFRPFAPSVLREDVGRLVRARRATRPTCCWWPTSCPSAAAP